MRLNFVPIQREWDCAPGRAPANMLSVGAEGNVQLQHISSEIGMQPWDGSERQKAQDVGCVCLKQISDEGENPLCDEWQYLRGLWKPLL